MIDRTESINALGALIKKYLAPEAANEQPKDFVLQINKELERRVVQKVGKPDNERRREMLQHFGIQPNEGIPNATFTFPAKERTEIVDIMSTPKLKKAYLHLLDFSGMSETRSVHEAMTKMVGNYTPLSKRLYLNP